MKVNIDEAVYDISEEIYRQLHRDSNNNKNNETILMDTINQYVDNYLDTLTTYDLNAILLAYGIDKAVINYAIRYDLNKINILKFSKNIIKNLIINTYEIII
jgi:hypothetical protein